MTDRFARCGLRAARIALLLATAWTFPAAADGSSETTLNLAVSAGQNYEAVEIVPSVTNAPAGATLTLVAIDPLKGTLTHAGLDISASDTFTDRSVAQPFAVYGYVIGSDGVTTNASAYEFGTMGRVHEDDDWLYESAETYTNGTGKGVWSGTEYISVTNGLLAINTVISNDFTATANCRIDTPETPYRGYVIETEVSFPLPYADLPDASGQRLGLTVCYDADDLNQVNFYYLSDSAWTEVPVETCDPLASTNWQVHISVDCSGQLATYCLRPSGTVPWTFVGTGTVNGSGAVSEMSFLGRGFVDETEGHGFDVELIEINVEFDPESLYPGVNFEHSVVTGRVTSSVIHDTTRLGGSFRVLLKNAYGETVAETSDYRFTAEETIEFYIPTFDVTPGMLYRAEIVFDDEVAEHSGENLTQEALMGRALTNGLAGTRGKWIDENVETYNGDLSGTGDWTGREYAWTESKWICVQTVLDEIASDAALSFEPTNVLEEAVSDYVANIRACFTEAACEPGSADAVFGFTVALTDEDKIAFYCLSNRVWRAVPQSVAEPELGVEYILTASVHTDLKQLVYRLTEPSGETKCLMTLTLDDDLCRVFEAVDVSGNGRFTDLTGSAYSTDLVRIHVDFDDNALYPGTNFTASAANGVIRFEQLWETDRTNGQITVVLRDKYGTVVGRRRLSFHGLDDAFPFDYYITGLTPGENYTVQVEADIKGIDDSGKADTAEGFMAKVLTNSVWTTDGWIRENVETFAGRAVGSGTWDTGDSYAYESDGVIAVDAPGAEDDSNGVGFAATNELPYHTGYEYRTRMAFDSASTDTLETDGEYGITIQDIQPEATSQELRFSVLVNGTWTVVDSDLFEPELGVEYEVTIRVDYKRSVASYRVQSVEALDAGETPVILAEFAISSSILWTPYETGWYGKGRIRSHEGDGFDVRLWEISSDLDRDALTPGTNFASTVVRGTVHINQLWLTDRNEGEYLINVYDAHGNLVDVRTLTYQELTNQNFNVSVTNLVAGEVYDVVVTADTEDGSVADSRAVIVQARSIGGWIHENAATVSHEEAGTGDWFNTNGVLSVVETAQGRALDVKVSPGEGMIVYQPTNNSLSYLKSNVRELRFDLNFNAAGWYSFEEPPEIPSNALAGVTVWCGSDDSLSAVNCALAVITSNNTWCVLTNTIGYLSAADRCTVKALVDSRAGYVRYLLESPTTTNSVHQYDIEPRDMSGMKFAITGSGTIWSIDGDAWDPNLIGSSTNEFADLESAILGTLGEDETLFPLWWADQLVTIGNGEFKVDDPDNMLTVRFPWWYYVEITTNGTVRVFRFSSSNNWIDYAQGGESNIVVQGSVFLVKTPQGLSWIAAQATNEWISGRIELANDIDLSIHNWTPIAGFSGTFDGKGKTIRGLNNSFHNCGIPNGEYVCGPTNAWGRSTYGLFGTATNATLTGVTFTEVAISNLADSVATLAGALAGNCAVSNVTVESGSVLGLGGTAAGVAGFADFADFLTFVNNTNRASVAAQSAVYGEGRYAAGLLCVAGPTNAVAPYGTVVVTNNVNTGTITNTIYDTDLLGGNVAQILAGTTLGARFGEVRLTDNVADGAIEATLVQSPENVIVQTNFPAVNLASAFWGFDAYGVFYRYLDANRAGAVAVDPYWHTARMLSDLFPNGTTNDVGVLNDAISASLPGATVTMTTGFDSWGPIVLDRDITFDLNGQMIYTIYVNNTFVISNGVTATVRNGTIAVGPESKAFVGDTSHLTQDVTIEDVPDEFYERTTISVNGEPISALYSSYLTEAMNQSGSVIELYEGADVELDVDSGELKVNGLVVAQLKDCYGFKAVTDDDGTLLGFEVKILDSAAPTADFSITGGDSGTVSVTVGNARPGFYYALQHKASLAEDWVTPPAEEWVRADANGAVLTAPTGGNQGYYRVLMSDVRPE